jgi:hypothetical protein
MIPITANVCLHHFATHHVAIIVTVTFKEMLLLLGNRRMISFIEAFFDKVNYLLTLVFGENCFGKASVKKASNSHWMLRLGVGRIKTWKVDIIGKIWSVILGLSVRVAKRVVSKILR